MIPDYVKDQIKERDIVSIIQDEGVELKREGSHYKCCCPFHEEKTPSFVVTPSRNLYHCFGCGRTGDAISFVMERRGIKAETAELFCIGYAPEKGGLKQYLTGLGWKEDVLLAAGLVKRNEDTGQVYDSFRHRIMFPVFWTSGYIAGF